MLTTQFGESANDLVKKSKGYRFGFPDFYAAEFPFAPMDYDQSRVYSGVIGKHYLDAKTNRYYYMYDPNMYLQPGFSGIGDDDARQATSRKIVIGTMAGLFAVTVASLLAVRAMRKSVEHDEWER